MKRDGDRAAKEGERSAQQLEQLSDHLAAMNARDFGQRLDEAQKLARMLASQPSPPGREAGREPILRLASSSAGVADLKYSSRPGVSKKLR